jgi:hypothetical protein
VEHRMTQRGVALVIAVDPVGTTMRHRIEHRFKLIALDRTPVEIQYGDDTAHVLIQDCWPRGQRAMAAWRRTLKLAWIAPVS